MPEGEIFRRGYNVMVATPDGTPANLFCVTGMTEFEIANVDKLIELALVATNQAPPAFMFFK